MKRSCLFNSKGDNCLSLFDCMPCHWTRPFFSSVHPSILLLGNPAAEEGQADRAAAGPVREADDRGLRRRAGRVAADGFHV